jgi:hypothetical protein
MNAKFLLRKYLNTGIPIPEYQFNKLNTNLRTTYIRKRSIAIESGLNVQTFEVPYISQDTWIKSLEKNVDNIQYIENPTPQVQMSVVYQNPINIQRIENPTDGVQDYILKNHKEYIFQIKNPNDKIKPLLDLGIYQVNAVKRTAYFIEYIENPTDEVQDYLLKNEHIQYIFRIKNPNNKIKSLLDLERNQMDAVKRFPYNIEFIKNPTDEVQMVAIKSSASTIQYIENPTDKVQDFILKNRPSYIKYINNPNEKIKRYRLRNNINESRIKIIINESQLKTIIKDII